MTKTTKKVFLVGFMASGKTTLGKRIANSLNLDFFDLDKYITQKLNKPISQIFKQDGENFFRNCEANFLDDFLDKNNFVLSTGGGTPCFFDNIQKMNKLGVTVFINTPLYIIISRLINTKNKRPLLENIDISEIPDFVETLYSNRLKYYQKSNIFFNPIVEDYNSLILKIENRFTKVF